jgi:hypothetical protein
LYPIVEAGGELGPYVEGGGEDETYDEAATAFGRKGTFSASAAGINMPLFPEVGFPYSFPLVRTAFLVDLLDLERRKHQNATRSKTTSATPPTAPAMAAIGTDDFFVPLFDPLLATFPLGTAAPVGVDPGPV